MLNKEKEEQVNFSEAQLEDFMNLFSGSQRHFGQWFLKGDNVFKKGDKVEGDYITLTDTLILSENYKKHLEGKVSLGIIPIDENNKCCFGVIDVDIYGRNLSDYMEAIEKGGFPLVPFKSKSKGLHLYLFLKDKTSAQQVKTILQKMATILSLDKLSRDVTKKSLEIFPKQSKVVKGKAGSFINIPYFEVGSGIRQAIKKGKELSFGEALAYIREKQTTLAEIKETLKELQYVDAPPCLQTLFLLNPFSENSGRNNYLFSFGVYLKKKDEVHFEQEVLDINQSLIHPLPENEVERTVLASLRRKDYMYKCMEAPCVDYCNKGECKNREYGIGKSEGYFSTLEYGQLTKFEFDAPYYEWQVRSQGEEIFKVLIFKNSNEIIKQDAFIQKCFETLNVFIPKLKFSAWRKLVNQSLQELKVVDMHKDYDMSPIVSLRRYIIEFITNRIPAATREQILIGKVFFSEEDKAYMFRPKDLKRYLDDQPQLKFIEQAEIMKILNSFGCKQKRIWTTGKKNSDRKSIRVNSIIKGSIEEVDTQDFVVDFKEQTEGDY